MTDTVTNNTSPPLDHELTAAVARMVDVFRNIEQERMSGVPVLNPALQVEAVDFRVWQSLGVGVLLTPWFMNLMLLPLGDVDWSAYYEGSEQNWTFPAGSFVFVVGKEPAVGTYQSCSLFSPVFEFDSQDAARATAIEALNALFDARLAPGHQSEAAVAPSARKISRRDLLRGAFLNKGEPHDGGA